jgi:hypothetical protein
LFKDSKFENENIYFYASCMHSINSYKAHALLRLF